MHSAAVDRNGSPVKRALSRGMSEDESLRCIIIQETETPSRRLNRSDSRGGTLKRKSGVQQSDQDIFKALPDVMELQSSYEEVLQEVRGLQVEREVLLFQVDVLQDALESTEELLAEARREAGHASMEVDQERAANRKLEHKVRALMSEVERLREDREALATLQAHALLLEEAKTYSTLDLAPSTLDPAPASPEETRVPLPRQRLLDIPLVQMSTLALDDPQLPAGVLGRPCGRRPDEDLERNNDTDSVSAYEDASADTPELDHTFLGLEDDLLDGGEEHLGDGEGGTDPKGDPNSSCVLS